MRLAWRPGGLPWQLVKLGVLHNGTHCTSCSMQTMKQAGPLDYSHRVPFLLGN